MNKLKVGVLGYGSIGKRHVEAFKNMPQVELAGVCDISFVDMQVPAELAKMAKNGLEVTDNYKRLLEICDVVSICTPNHLHVPQGVQAANNNKHVITEKPMALTVEEANQLILTCQGHVQLHVVKQDRLNRTVQELKQAIDQGCMGKLVLGSVNILWTRPQEYFDAVSWRGTKSFDGGMLFNQASHHIDLLQWLMGPIKSVQAYTSQRLRDIETEDVAAVALEFESGAVGTITVTICTYPKNIEGSITILGEKGSVKLTGNHAEKVEHWETEKQVDERKIDPYTAPHDKVAHTEYLERAVDTIIRNNPALVSGDEGLESIKVIEAIYKSAKLGRKIKV